MDAGVGGVSVVGIASSYGLDRPRIESRWGKVFRTRPDDGKERL